MKGTSYVIFSILILAAVVPEIISGAPATAESNVKSSIRQMVGCTGQCFRLRSRAIRDCRTGINAGNQCVLQTCNTGFPNPGTQCVFVQAAPPMPPALPPADGTCPNRCFVPSTSSADAILSAQTSAQQDCVGRSPTCLVRPCSSSPLDGFICARPCPNVCRASEALARQDCSGAVRCSVQPCTLPTGAVGSSCGTPASLTIMTQMIPTSTPSPTMTPGASPSASPTAAVSPSVTPSSSPSPTVSVSPTPSPNCTFSVGAIGAEPATAFCRCGSSTATVTVPAAVDDAGMTLAVANEVPGQTGYTNCVVAALRQLCTPDTFSMFSSRGRTDVENCCSTNVVDGMGLSRATNQCRIGDGCTPITVPAVSALITAGQTISCMCSGMTMTTNVLQIVDTATMMITMLTPAQTATIEAYQTCLQTMIGPLCSSTGISTFMTMADAAVLTCCGAGGAGGMAMGTECVI